MVKDFADRRRIRASALAGSILAVVSLSLLFGFALEQAIYQYWLIEIGLAGVTAVVIFFVFYVEELFPYSGLAILFPTSILVIPMLIVSQTAREAAPKDLSLVAGAVIITGGMAAYHLCMALVMRHWGARPQS